MALQTDHVTIAAIDPSKLAWIIPGRAGASNLSQAAIMSAISRNKGEGKLL